MVGIAVVASGAIVLMQKPTGPSGSIDDNVDFDGITFCGNSTGNLTLNTSLPDGTPDIKAYQISSPIFNLSFCKKTIEEIYPGWLDNETKIDDTRDKNSTRFAKGDEVIWVNNIGCLEFTNWSAQNKWRELYMDALYDRPSPINNNITGNRSSGRSGDNSTNGTTDNGNSTKENGTSSEPVIGNTTLLTINGQLSRAELYNKSVQYVKDHGGLPDNYYLSWDVHGETSRADRVVIEQFIFHFDRKIDGMPVVGAGEGANVDITPIGDIYHYTVLWRDISDSYKNLTVKNATAAFNLLKEKIYWNLTIEKIELGYYSANFHKSQDKLLPIWVFYYDLEHNSYFCVDAVGLKFVR